MSGELDNQGGITNSPSSQFRNRIAGYLLLPLLLYFAGAFFYVSVKQISYPWELEWFEGAMMLRSVRLMEGKPLYPQPEQGYVPHPYPPFYDLVVGGLTCLTGVHLGVGRAVSLLATLGTVLLIGLIVYRMTHWWGAVLLAAGSYLAFYKLSGFWYSLNRVDSLAWMLALACCYCCYSSRANRPGRPNRPGRHNRLTPWAGGLLGALALLSKQSTLGLVVCGLLFLLIDNWREFRWAAITFFLVLGNGAWVSSQGGNSWFFVYYFEIFGRHPLLVNYQSRGLWLELGRYFIVPGLLTLSWLIFRLRDGRRGRELFWLAVFVVCLATALVSYLKIGAYVNNFMPLLIAAAVMMGLAYDEWRKEILRHASGLLPLVNLQIIILIGLLPLLYKPAAALPYPGSEQKGRELTEKIASLPGTVYCLHHNYYTSVAGKGYSYNVDAVRELQYADLPMPDALWQSIEERRFDYLILDLPPQPEWLPGELSFLIQHHYTYVGLIITYNDDRELRPITGCWMKPRLLYHRR